MKRLSFLLLVLVFFLAACQKSIEPYSPMGLGFVGVKATTIRAAAALTTSYVATADRQIDDANQLVLHVAFTLGSSTGCYLKVEFSEDASTWYQESSVSISSGVVTHTVYIRELTASGNYVIAIPILGTWYKVSALANTSGTSTSLTITEVRGKV